MFTGQPVSKEESPQGAGYQPSKQMDCTECGGKLRKVNVTVEGTRKKAVSYQCGSCDFFMFEKASAESVLKDLRETPLKIRQRIIKLSKDRLGMYLNTNVVRSLNIQKGEEVYVSVPDSRHIVIERTQGAARQKT